MFQVHLRLDVRLIRRCELFVIEQLPVNAAEEGMRLDVRETRLMLTA